MGSSPHASVRPKISCTVHAGALLCPWEMELMELELRATCAAQVCCLLQGVLAMLATPEMKFRFSQGFSCSSGEQQRHKFWPERLVGHCGMPSGGQEHQLPQHWVYTIINTTMQGRTLSYSL